MLALILAVITRWTAHYCSAARLLDIAKGLLFCVIRYENELLDSAGPANSDARKVADEVIGIVRDKVFWEKLLEMKIALRPLAIAANITQATETRLDHVAIAMGCLYHTFSQPNIPDMTRTAVQQSLENRWGKTDHDPFVAGVYFHPFFRHYLFNQEEPALRPLGIYTILKRLFARLLPGETLLAGAFMQANATYASAKGHFSDENMCIQELEELQGTDDEHVTLARIWANLAVGERSGEQQFARLGHLCVSVFPTSAGCERLFSQMGITHTKLRNRLSLPSSRKIVQLKMDVRVRQAREGLIQSRPKRRQFCSKSPGDSENEPESDSDDEIDGEVDTHRVIQELMDDVEADEDVVDEAQGGDAGGDNSAMDVGMDSGNQRLGEHVGRQRLPRIVFRWTRELTLARLFDYKSISDNHPGWRRARRAWAGGVANLESEMHQYGLDNIFEEQDMVMSD